MKKIALIIILFMPVLLSAQKHQKVIEKAMKLYTDDPSFNYTEISNELLKEMVNVGNLDSESKSKLLKIERIRFLEVDTNYQRRKIYQINNNVPVSIKQTDKGVVIKQINKTNPSSINNPQTIISNQSDWFFDDFTTGLNLNSYNILLKRKHKKKNIMFLKRKVSDSLTEYVLISDTSVIQIIGDLNLKTVSEIKNIVDELAKMSF